MKDRSMQPKHDKAKREAMREFIDRENDFYCSSYWSGRERAKKKFFSGKPYAVKRKVRVATA